ncbi:glycoside hydrolase family 3 protein [Labedaea rhizosphaerae]|uniref:Beta-N-acetylhexosaminidase n=1 Tax=Labedaea rhizosphaerae TaxID=598644 RepID=A0A4R6SQY0_LABRH|nr:glycoside hydrolase family 3 N-terminal domain-containing protein [Labedaea rhizosphaerae]TDQ05972.1 beta-N-acetylhexosaminidase [Labedaea rhizosphaerae]
MSELERLARATLLPGFEGSTAPDWVLSELDAGLGGVTLFAINGNVPDTESLSALTEQLRSVSVPVITIDEEGGDVTRLAHLTGSPYPGNAALGAVDDVELTANVYRSMGAELAQVGVTLNFAPTVDVNTADDNPIIGTRSFGADPELVGRHAAAAVTGLQSSGIAACAKHFPGHGATVADSHLELPTVDADLDLLDRRELVPFKAAIAVGTKAVMIAHLNVPAVTGGEPATLSRAAITGLLRDKLGYDGVIVTDALDMRGASGVIGIPEAAVRALIAGADLLCLGPREHAESVAATAAAIVRAVEDGRLPMERLAQAAARVADMQSWVAEPSVSTVDWSTGLAVARRALLVAGVDGVQGLGTPLVVELEAPGNIAVGPVPWGLGPWVPDDDVLRVDAGAAKVADTVAEILAKAGERPLVVVVRDAHRHPEQRELAAALAAARPDTTVVEMGLPIWRPDNVRYIASYGATRANGRAVAERLGLIAG